MKKIKRLEISFVISGILLLLALMVGSIYALDFLSTTLVDSLTLNSQSSPGVKFNLEGFKQLNLP